MFLGVASEMVMEVLGRLLRGLLGVTSTILEFSVAIWG